MSMKHHLLVETSQVDGEHLEEILIVTTKRSAIVTFSLKCSHCHNYSEVQCQSEISPGADNAAGYAAGYSSASQWLTRSFCLLGAKQHQ